jgi:predicted DNA-binding transcriptional regulator AlpA
MQTAHATVDRRPEKKFVMTPEAARLVGLSPRTLETFRCRGSGPVFRKIGGRVLYATDDLQAWLDRAACRSTSEDRYEAALAASRAWRARP